MREKSSAKGFSLIELLVVVGVILILASIAVPNFLKARRSANEAAAVASLKAIGSGQLAYRSSQGDFVTLDIYKSGYNFSSSAGTTPSLEFTATAEPAVSTGITATGTRFFFVNQDQVIRCSAGSSADANSSPLQN
ncbi:MAG: hypothetical protein DMG05_03690 [Acidobacteria bacterium]|nr:MAG: hypothetical protein DMG05_03690 [Acidobacteriota bacterium]